MSDVTHAHIPSLSARSFAPLRFPWQRGQRVYLLERTGMDRPHTSEATMNKLTAIFAALALAACGKTDDPAQQFRDALPKAQAAKIGTYQDAGAATGVATQALGDTNIAQSEYAVMSFYLALSVNGGAKMILDLLQFIVSHPSTSCVQDTSCTWGPWAGDQGHNFYQLVVTKQGDAYAYALSGRNADVAGSTFVELLVGTATPVDRDHGSGRFTLDFDAVDAALSHGAGYVKTDYGQLSVTYDNTVQSPTVSAIFLGARNQDPNDPHFMNAAYEFVAATSGGTLQVAVENLDTGDTLRLETRWSASGQGRADVLFTAGAGGSITASECWAGRSQDFDGVYDTKHLDIPQLQDANGCAPFTTFQAADISLPPT